MEWLEGITFPVTSYRNPPAYYPNSVPPSVSSSLSHQYNILPTTMKPSSATTMGTTGVFSPLQLPLNPQEEAVQVTKNPSSIEKNIDNDDDDDDGNDDDICTGFGNKTFHYLDPFKIASATREHMDSSVSRQQQQRQEILTTEAESFFENFDFPSNIGAEIENDDVFVKMLEQMVL